MHWNGDPSSFRGAVMVVGMAAGLVMKDKSSLPKNPNKLTRCKESTIVDLRSDTLRAM